MKKWDGKTKGSLWGYKFFVFCINFLGLRIAYFFCYFVAYYYILFASKQREGLIQFYMIGFCYSRKKAKKLAFQNFYMFGQTLIDRIAMFTKREDKFTYTFNNEKVIKNITAENKGGILISGHLGNWEIAGNLIHDRITSAINILMLDAEVEKIKQFLEMKTGGVSYNVIPIKDDMSHLILMHQALKRNELIVINADRTTPGSKYLEMEFLASKAKFPLGPFVLAEKFKVSVTFVYAVKGTNTHYELFATDPLIGTSKADEVAQLYTQHLASMVKKYPTQWFNFYNYYAD